MYISVCRVTCGDLLVVLPLHLQQHSSLPQHSMVLHTEVSAAPPVCMYYMIFSLNSRLRQHALIATAVHKPVLVPASCQSNPQYQFF